MHIAVPASVIRKGISPKDALVTLPPLDSSRKGQMNISAAYIGSTSMTANEMVSLKLKLTFLPIKPFFFSLHVPFIKMSNSNFEGEYICPRSSREYVLNFHKKQYRRLVRIEAREHGTAVVLNQEQVMKSKGKDC